MTKRKNSRRADPTKAQKKSATKNGTCSDTNKLLKFVCAVCVSFAPIATRRMIFLIFRQEIKDRGRHNSRRSFCDCYIYPGAYSVYRYRSLADDMDMCGDCPLRENIHPVVFSVTVIILLDRLSGFLPMRQVSEYPYREYGFLFLRILR